MYIFFILGRGYFDLLYILNEIQVANSCPLQKLGNSKKNFIHWPRAYLTFLEFWVVHKKTVNNFFHTGAYWVPIKRQRILRT
jgi:hypothetical protein